MKFLYRKGSHRPTAFRRTASAGERGFNTAGLCDLHATGERQQRCIAISPHGPIAIDGPQGLSEFGDTDSKLFPTGPPQKTSPPGPARYAETVDPAIEIEKLVYGGQGLGRLDGHVALVPFVLPGERVEIEPFRQTPKLIRARATAWQQRSPVRVPPACPLFERCGGCHYQHIPSEKQLEYKIQILRETLSRVGRIGWDGPIETVSANPWAYRNRTQLHIRSRGTKRDKKLVVGLLEAGSHLLIEADTCPINSPALNRAHAGLLEMVRDRRFPSFVREVEFFTNETDVQVTVSADGRPIPKALFDLFSEKIDGFSPDGTIDYSCGGNSFQVAGGSFFQVNRFLVDKLAELAVGDASGQTVLDLYAGVGLFSLPLGERFEEVIAADSSAKAIRSLQFNAERANRRVRLIHADVEDFLPSVTEPVDFVITDPPRAGLGPRVTAELLRIQPASLIIVSCDPATLARDLKVLIAGGLEIESITLVDLFPQTFHLESVVRLRRE